jgi:hypothetical protein
VNWTYRPIPPEVRARMKRPTEPSPFTASWSSTSTLLDHEAKALNAKDRIIMLDVTEADVRLDGMLRSSARPTFDGVAVAVTGSKGPLLFACSRFRGWQNNVRGIALGMESLRKLERYGIVNTDEQYRGWQALPPATPPTWADVLAGYSGWTVAAVRVDPLNAYRVAARATHPDTGGTDAAFQAVNDAYQQSRSA